MVKGIASANVLILCNAVLRSCAAIAIMPVMIHYLGAERYGIWITVSTITMYVSLCESGLGQTVVNLIGRNVALRKFDEAAEVMTTAHVLYWMIVTPVAIVSTIAVIWLPIGAILLTPEDAAYEGPLRQCLALSIVLALARIPLLVFPGLLIGVRKMPTRVCWEIGGTLAYLSATLLALACGLGLVGAVIAANIAMFFSSLAVGISSSRCGEWARLRLSRFRPSLLKPLAVNSGYFFVINVAGIVERSCTVLLAPRLASLALTPAYFLLVSLFRVSATMVVSSLPKAAQPYVVMLSTQNHFDRLSASAQLLTKSATLLATCCVIGFVPFAEQAFDSFLGEGSYPGDAASALVILAFLADSLTVVSSQYLTAMNRHKKLALVMLIKAVGSLSLSLLLGIRMANPIVGLALGSAIASVLSALAIPCLIRPELKLSWKQFLGGFVARPLACVAAGTSTSYLAVLYLDPGPPRVLFVLVLAVATGYGAWRGLFNPDERALITKTGMSIVSRFRYAIP